jgi:hypothetical protein
VLVLLSALEQGLFGLPADVAVQQENKIMQEPPNYRRAKPNEGCHEHAEHSLQLAAVAAVYQQHDPIVQLNDTIELCKW